MPPISLTGVYLALKVDFLLRVFIRVSDVDGRLITTFIRLSNGLKKLDNIFIVVSKFTVPVHNFTIAMLHRTRA